MRAPLSPKAIAAFGRLTPEQQTRFLWFIARLARVKPSSLLATDAQRIAAREATASAKARERETAELKQARHRIAVQLDELRARINRRRAGAWGTVEMTATERRKRERLYAELNKLDGIA